MKKAIIIGGSSGIGYGLAQVLLENNYKVAIIGLKPQSKIIEKEHLIVKELDCILEDTIKCITDLIDTLDGLDLLVFSAGIGNLNKDKGHLVENHANQLNVIAFTTIADWTYRYFLKQGKGHFTAITSISGLFGSRVAPAYHAAKAYQINYIEGLQQKAKKSKLPIYVTDIRPGYVDTNMIKDKKVFWVASIEKSSHQIFNLIKSKSNKGYISKRWNIIALFIKVLPKYARVRL